MKKKILFFVFLIAAGAFAYYGGYHAYTSSRPKSRMIETESLQKAVQMDHTDKTMSEEYYIGKIESDQLVIYKMPEDVIYDSVELSSLSFYDEERDRLLNGMVFEDLTAVFEFLENSMS